MKGFDVQTSNVSFSVKEGNVKRNILDDISYNFESNKITTIGGPSGSGKTTLLYALAGILNIDKGDVRIGEKSIYGMSLKERDDFRLHNISFIYQNLNLFSFMNVEQNILLPFMLRKEEVNEKVREKMDYYLDLMELGNIKKKDIQSLSGGEQQRIAIIRSIIADMKLILADEPTGNLDKQNTIKFMKCLTKIKEDSDTTIIIVTHDENVYDFGDNKLKLDNGQIAEKNAKQ
ncbi:ATP-binding cassette domain-containing protein [Hathewaya histolytica]|uniref:ATP-binding cassette domain-containing protein n=1 Tax=Hathewaya histolytica TaxID=1498 RepID=UPI003B66B4DC